LSLQIVSSEYTKHRLESLHQNIAVYRHPDHLPDSQDIESSITASLQNLTLDAAGVSKLSRDNLKGLYGTRDDMILYWAHHEKLCLIDGKIAFMGGLDLCYGRWDTYQHAITDVHPTDLNETVFPGQDYNNARVLDFQDVSHWEDNQLDRKVTPRMGWSDVSVSIYGPIVEDLRRHFVDRWNFIYDTKYHAQNDPRYSRLALYVRPTSFPGQESGSHPRPQSQQSQGSHAASPLSGGQGESYASRPLPGSHGQYGPSSSQSPEQHTLTPASGHYPQSQQPQGSQTVPGASSPLGGQVESYPGPPSSYGQHGPPSSQHTGQYSPAPALGHYPQSQGSQAVPGASPPSGGQVESYSSGPSSSYGQHGPPTSQPTGQYSPAPALGHYPQSQQPQGSQAVPGGSPPPGGQVESYSSGPPSSYGQHGHPTSHPTGQYSSVAAPDHYPQSQRPQGSGIVPGVSPPPEGQTESYPSEPPGSYGQHGHQGAYGSQPSGGQQFPPPPPGPPSSSQPGAGYQTQYVPGGYGSNFSSSTYNAPHYSPATSQAAQGPYFPPPPTQELDKSQSHSQTRGLGDDSKGSGSTYQQHEYERGLRSESQRLRGDLTGFGNVLRGQLAGQVRQYQDRYLGSRGRHDPHPKGSMWCQIVRSSSKWSNGTPTEHSIANAYATIIRDSHHFVYIENQFFITATSDQQKPVQNMIGAAIVERILRAARAGEKYKIIVVIPSVPGFPGDLRDESTLGTRAIMEFQYNSINRGGYSIMEIIAREGYNPMDYIRFYNLRNYDRINVNSSMLHAEQRSGVDYEDARKHHEVAALGHPGHGLGAPGSAFDTTAPFQQYQQAAQQAQHGYRHGPSRWDSVSQCYMLDGEDIRNVPWDSDVPEIDAFVSEELYVHTKVGTSHYTACGNISDLDICR
jgi:phospholipase D1/2